MSNSSPAAQLPAWVDAQIFGRAANYYTANASLKQAATQIAFVDSKNNTVTLRGPLDANVGDILCICDPGGWAGTNAVTFVGQIAQVQNPNDGSLADSFTMSANYAGFAWALVQDPLARQNPTNVNKQFWALIWVSPLSVSGGGGTFYQTVRDSGVAKTQRPNLNFIGATVADNPGTSSTDVTLSTGVTFSGTTTISSILTRVPWRVQPVGTAAGVVTITAPAGALEGDVIELPDADGTYGVNALTFNGNGRNVQDPYRNPPTAAATWVSPAGAYPNPAWILLKSSAGATPANTLIWRSMRAT